MTYKNQNSLSDNLEIDMLRTMIVVVTIIAVIFAVFAESSDEFSFVPWMYVITTAPIIFLATLFLRRYLTITIITLSVFLLLGMVIFRKNLFINDDGLSFYNLTVLIVHFGTMLSFFIKASRTLRLSDEEAFLSNESMNSQGNSISRKLSRRRKRREGYNSRNKTKIKSGQYRG